MHQKEKRKEEVAGNLPDFLNTLTKSYGWDSWLEPSPSMCEVLGLGPIIARMKA